MSKNRLCDQSAGVVNRRTFLEGGVLAACSLAPVGQSPAEQWVGAEPARAAEAKPPTRFVHACMTLPYRNFPLERALTGIKDSGYDHVAWGTQHREDNGENRPVMPADAPPAQAAALARRCRDLGLEPVQMFSMIYPDDAQALTVLTQRIKQASAADMPMVLVFGPTQGGDPKLWVQRFKALGPVAADHNVTLVMKQHGGETTGTGQALARILEEVDHPNVWMSYDASRHRTGAPTGPAPVEARFGNYRGPPPPHWRPPPVLHRWRQGLATTAPVPATALAPPTGPAPVEARFGNYRGRFPPPHWRPHRSCTGGGKVWQLPRRHSPPHWRPHRSCTYHTKIPVKLSLTY
jgi:hypothetical protein